MELVRFAGAVIGGAIGGGLGGLLASLFSKGGKRSSAQGAIVMVPVLVLGQVGYQVGDSEAFRDLLSPPTRLERVTRKHTQGLKDMPAFKARLAGLTPEGARNFGEQLAHAGLKRLAPADLDRWNQLRQTLATQSPSICAGLWTGKLDRSEVQSTVEKLADPDLDDWVRISASSMRLELSATAPIPDDQAALRIAVENLVAPLAEPEADRMRRDLAAGVALDNGEACWAMQTVMKTAAGLPPAKREQVLRTLAAL